MGPGGRRGWGLGLGRGVEGLVENDVEQGSEVGV